MKESPYMHSCHDQCLSLLPSCWVAVGTTLFPCVFCLLDLNGFWSGQRGLRLWKISSSAKMFGMSSVIYQLKTKQTNKLINHHQRQKSNHPGCKVSKEVRWHESGTLMPRNGPFIKEAAQSLDSGYSKDVCVSTQWTAASPKHRPHQTPPLAETWLQISSLRTQGRDACMLYEPLRLWDFVTVPQASK